MGEKAKSELSKADGDRKQYLQYVIDFQQKSLNIPENEWLKSPTRLPLDEDVYIKQLHKEDKKIFPLSWRRR